MAGAFIAPKVAFRIGVLLVALCLHTTVAQVIPETTTTATTTTTTATTMSTTISSASSAMKPWQIGAICLCSIDFVLVFTILCYFGMLQIN